MEQDSKIQVLFVCTGNSARSQMAEGILRKEAGDIADAYSAGTEPAEEVNPLAKRMMTENGIDPSDHYPKKTEKYLDKEFDVIVTTCDGARKNCPLFPGKAVRYHWGLDDPAAVTGDEATRLAAFRKTFAKLSERITGVVEVIRRMQTGSVLVELSEIIDGMEIQMGEMKPYLDKSTGEVILVTDEDMRTAEDDESLEDYSEWERESIQKVRRMFFGDGVPVQLPTQFDIHEYQIMQRFCGSVEDENVSDSLYDAITGSGAFRRFKDGVYRFGIQDDWYKYRAEAFRKIAIEWCEDNEVEYIDNVAESSQ